MSDLFKKLTQKLNTPAAEEEKKPEDVVPAEETSVAETEEPMEIETAEAETAEEESTESTEEEAAEPAGEDTPVEEKAPVAAAESETNPTDELLAKIQKKRPYKDRYYLLYGNEENPPEGVNMSGTLEFLQGLGFGNNSLQKAREEKDLSERIGASMLEKSNKVCSFCGIPMVGTEYDVLKDGRMRCPSCSRTTVKRDNVEALFETTKKNMEQFYDIKFRDGIHVEMVNAKKLHKKLNKKFITNGRGDGRFVVAAIQEKKGYRLLIETGSPRMQAVREMAHILTNIWQLQNWNDKEITAKYGLKKHEIAVGMCMWAEVQYCFLIGEVKYGKFLEVATLARKDDYGRGFERFCKEYPITYGSVLDGETPFADKSKPL